MESTPRITVSTTRKINLGNYESQDVFVCLSGVPISASDDLIASMLLTGEKAVKAISARITSLVQDARKNAAHAILDDLGGDI